MIEFKENMRNNKVYLKIENMDASVRRAIRQGWFAFGHDLRDTTSKDIIRRPKSGRTYIVRGPSGRRRRHVASAPGETHANLSGKLRRSLGFQISGWSSMEFGYMRETPDYAGFVEFGTKKMAGRPSLRNNIRGLTRNGVNHFNDAIKREHQ